MQVQLKNELHIYYHALIEIYPMVHNEFRFNLNSRLGQVGLKMKQIAYDQVTKSLLWFREFLYGKCLLRELFHQGSLTRGNSFKGTIP
jgi:hypothetical protein